jgi:hypothetical protein
MVRIHSKARILKVVRIPLLGLIGFSYVCLKVLALLWTCMSISIKYVEGYI